MAKNDRVNKYQNNWIIAGVAILCVGTFFALWGVQNHDWLVIAGIIFLADAVFLALCIVTQYREHDISKFLTFVSGAMCAACVLFMGMAFARV